MEWTNPSQLSAPVALLSILEDDNSDEDPLFGDVNQKFNTVTDVTVCFPWLTMKSDINSFSTYSRIMGDKQTFNSEGSIYEYMRNKSKENRKILLSELVNFCCEDIKTTIPLHSYHRAMQIIKKVGWWGNGTMDDNISELKEKVINVYEQSTTIIQKLYPRLKSNQFELIWNHVTSNIEDISIDYEFGDDIDNWKSKLDTFIDKNFNKKQKALEIYYLMANAIMKRKLYQLFTTNELTKVSEYFWKLGKALPDPPTTTSTKHTTINDSENEYKLDIDKTPEKSHLDETPQVDK
ncbi:hypothetical protein QTN25_000882 [Entamoeba marina]